MNAPLPMTTGGWYSAKDLAGLPGMPGSERRVLERAKKNLWPSRAKERGKGLEYPITCLPAATKHALLTQQLQTPGSSPAAPAAVSPAALPVAGLFTPCADLTDAQRLERDARSGVRAAIQRLQASGASQEAAITTLLTSARAGQCDPHVDKMLRLARDKRGRKNEQSGDGYPSSRTLKRWLSAKDLTPKLPQADMRVPDWARRFLAIWQVPQKPSVDAAWREFSGEYPGISIHQVRRLVGKLGAVTRERGRMGPRELKNIKPFIRRDFSHLEPNDIWTADGHCFDAEVQHPLHGRPFRPEITAILDIATRRCVGWSVDLAESGTAVADAIRYAAERCGIPAIFYVDNGGGYQNAMMKDETTGLMSRLGTDMRHSIAYNSQARGVIERAHQTIFVAAAKQLPSYIGAAMDREARLAQFKVTRKALKHGGTMPLIPFDVFIEFIEARVADYNAKAHRSLKGTSPDLAWRAFEAQGWQAEMLRPEDTETLFRPRVTRTIARAEINLFTNIYFARELAEFHGIDAQIAYDIHDASRVWVYTPEGRFICEAQANGNRRHYMPVPVVQQAREKRAKGRLARVDAKRDEILEELHGAPALNAPTSSQIVIGGRVIDAAALATIECDSRQLSEKMAEAEARAPVGARTTPAVSRSDREPSENYADWLAIDRRLTVGDPVSEAEAVWHTTYQTTSQYRVQAKKKAAA